MGKRIASNKKKISHKGLSDSLEERINKANIKEKIDHERDR